jgi:glycosyltransferase involved in cell wall biosynthesis
MNNQNTTIQQTRPVTPESELAFSLVVPTIGRVDEVRALLSSIRRLGLHTIEVIVVDQSEDDLLTVVCAEFADALPLRHVRVSFRGAARARNHGAKLAQARWLNFPDDDCELFQSTLERARDGLSEGAPVLIGMAVDRAGEASTTRFKQDKRRLSLWSMWGRNIEFTMFFDRQVFIESGGYDEEFGVGSAYGSEEGAELLIRLLRALPSGAVAYDSSVRFYHPNKVTAYSEKVLERSYSYARGTGALVAKWPLLPVWYFAFGFVLRTFAAIVIFRGLKRQYYRRRLAGLLSGFFDYRRTDRGRSPVPRPRGERS